MCETRAGTVLCLQGDSILRDTILQALVRIILPATTLRELVLAIPPDTTRRAWVRTTLLDTILRAPARSIPPLSDLIDLPSVRTISGGIATTAGVGIFVILRETGATGQGATGAITEVEMKAEGILAMPDRMEQAVRQTRVIMVGASGTMGPAQEQARARAGCTGRVRTARGMDAEDKEFTLVDCVSAFVRKDMSSRKGGESGKRRACRFL